MSAYRLPDYTHIPNYNPNDSYDPTLCRITSTTLNKSTRYSPIRPLPPRLPDILWTEFDDTSLLSSTSALIPGKTKAACTRRLMALRLEASLRAEAFESFTLFSKLPLELQHMVWKFAAEEPRVVELHSVSLTAHLEPLHPDGWAGHTVQRHCFRSRTFDPPLLSTCLTSRAIALRNRNYTAQNLGHDMFPDSVYFSLPHDIAFFSAKSLEKWFVTASEAFHKGKWSVRAKTAFPSSGFATNAGSKIRRELKTLALDAGWFLGVVGKEGGGRGEEVKRQNVRVNRECLVVVWMHVWHTIKREFEGVERLVLVLGDGWVGDGKEGGELGDKCFAAMRLEGVKEGDGKWEVLDALRKKLGNWKTWREETGAWVAVDVELATVRSFGKKGK